MEKLISQKDIVNYHNPIAGSLTLHIIHTPDKTPGVLGFCASRITSGNGSKTGFYLTGAPGKIKDGFSEGLTVMYPHDKPSPFDIDLNRSI